MAYNALTKIHNYNSNYKEILTYTEVYNGELNFNLIPEIIKGKFIIIIAIIKKFLLMQGI